MGRIVRPNFNCRLVSEKNVAECQANSVHSLSAHHSFLVNFKEETTKWKKKEVT